MIRVDRNLEGDWISDSLCQGVTDDDFANSNYIFMLTSHESTDLTKRSDREPVFLLVEFEFLKGNYVSGLFVPGAKHDTVGSFFYLVESLIAVYRPGWLDGWVGDSEGNEGTMYDGTAWARALRGIHRHLTASTSRLWATFERLLMSSFSVKALFVPFTTAFPWCLHSKVSHVGCIHLELALGTTTESLMNSNIMDPELAPEMVKFLAQELKTTRAVRRFGCLFEFEFTVLLSPREILLLRRTTRSSKKG